MSSGEAVLRPARAADWPEILDLWTALFADDPSGPDSWSTNAAEWFQRSVGQRNDVTLPVIEVAGRIIATAIGSLEIGVPNPWSRRGRAVRLENVYTRPDLRGHGFATRLVLDVVRWSKEVGADRVDLGTTELGRRIYQNVGFEETSATRMKLVL